MDIIMHRAYATSCFFKHFSGQCAIMPIKVIGFSDDTRECWTGEIDFMALLELTSNALWGEISSITIQAFY